LICKDLRQSVYQPYGQLATGYCQLLVKELFGPAHWARPSKTQQPSPRNTLITRRAENRQVCTSRSNVMWNC